MNIKSLKKISQFYILMLLVLGSNLFLIQSAAAALSLKDLDGDGYSTDGTVGGKKDCNDFIKSISPAATEICDGVDNDCDGFIDEIFAVLPYYKDSDGDGFGDLRTSSISCQRPSGYVPNSQDCNDANKNVSPIASEVCDGIDNNCRGGTDEGLPTKTYYKDSDGDNYGSVDTSKTSCNAITGYVVSATDCNDANKNISPAASETCDGIDNNCNSLIDDGMPTAIYYQDADGDGYGLASDSQSSCAAPSGYVTDNSDCDDADNAISPVATETCDGVDNNCNKAIDDGLPLATYYLDNDGDGYGSSKAETKSSCTIGYVTNNSDCNDYDAAYHVTYFKDWDGDGYGSLTGDVTTHGSPTSCENSGKFVATDDDCDDDEAAIHPSIYYKDADGDGYGSMQSSDTKIHCGVLIGYVNHADDCDDTDPLVNTATNFYKDADGDGYGLASDSQSSCTATSISGYVTDDSDCDDTKVSVLWYFDVDGDGHGSKTVSYLDCSEYFGGEADPDYTTTATDCNDYRSDAYDGATELCDGIDNNCDGTIDEGFTTGTLYLDWDVDGFGTPLVAEETCYDEAADGTLTPRVGYSADNTDCNDGVDTIHDECIEDDCTKAGIAACNIYTAPDTIATCDGDATNDTDATDALNAWLETVPDGANAEYSIADFGGKCFATKGTVELYGRHNITIEGHDGTIKAIDYKTCSLCKADHGGTWVSDSDGDGTISEAEETAFTTEQARIAADEPDDASYKPYRAQFSIEAGFGFRVQNLTIEGNLIQTSSDGTALAVDTLYEPAREKEFNLTLMGPTDVTIDNVHFLNSWSDAVMLSGTTRSTRLINGVKYAYPAWTTSNYYATDITIQNSSIDGAGRHALGCGACTNLIVQDNDIRNIGYAVVDVELEGSDNEIHGDISLIGNTIGAFRTNLLTASTGQFFDSTLGPFVLQNNTQEVAGYLIPIHIGHDDVPVSSVEITGNTFMSQSTASFRIEGAEDVKIHNNKTSQLNYHAAYLKNVTKAEVKNNEFTGAWGIAWFGPDNNFTTNTTCSNNTMIGVSNNADFGRWTNLDTTYGDEYLITEGCETFDCRQDWNGDGSIDYSDC